MLSRRWRVPVLGAAGTVVLVAGIVAWLEVRVGHVLAPVASWPTLDMENVALGQGAGELWDDCSQDRSLRITQYLDLDLFRDAPGERQPAPDAWKDLLRRLNFQYLGDLGFTLALVLPVALLLLLVAILGELLDRSGRRWLLRLSSLASDVGDNVPYILWAFPAVLGARSWRTKNVIRKEPNPRKMTPG